MYFCKLGIQPKYQLPRKKKNQNIVGGSHDLRGSDQPFVFVSLQTTEELEDAMHCFKIKAGKKNEATTNCEHEHN